jgi:predicted HTH domain antitoxin
MSVVIPDDILQAAKLSDAELKQEIAILLYQQKRLSSGKARRLAGMSLIEFQKELTRRGVCIHYDVEDFQAEVEMLKTLGEL